MSQVSMELQEIGKRGRDLYERSIRARVEAEHRGEYVAIDVSSGDYEVDPNSLAAAAKLRMRQPAAVIFFIRIGLPPIRLGGGLRRTAP